MPISRSYTLACDCPGCDVTATVDVPAGQTMDANLPPGWGYWGRPGEDRYHCDNADCVTHAEGVKETERAERAAARTSKTREEVEALATPAPEE